MPKNGSAQSSYYKKQFYTNYNIISAAYHESGHTICGLLNFMKINLAEINLYKDGRIGGAVYYESYLDYENGIDFSIKKHIIIGDIKLSYAGIAAEKILLKNISGSNKSPIFLKWGAKDDTSTAAFLIEKYQLAPRGRKRYNFKQKMIKEISQELNQHWDAVVAVSQFLYNKKEINYIDLKKILCTKIPNKKFWKNQFKKIDRIFDNDFELDENAIKSIIFS